MGLEQDSHLKDTLEVLSIDRRKVMRSGTVSMRCTHKLVDQVGNRAFMVVTTQKDWITRITIQLEELTVEAIHRSIVFLQSRETINTRDHRRFSRRETLSGIPRSTTIPVATITTKA